MKRKKVSAHKLHLLIDMLFLCGYETILFFSTIAFQLKFYQATLLFFFVPGIYLIIRKTKKIKHILIASIAGLGLCFIFDFVATLNHAWFIPNDQILLPRFLGVVPIDDLIWFVGWIFFMTTFYEHFIDTTRNKNVSSHLKWAIFVSLVILCLVVGLFYIAPSLLQIHYAYLVCIVASLPFFIYALSHKPSLIFSLIKVTAFFTPLLLLYELSALITHQWIFPGFYIGHVELLGLTMPFEEFFFWILLSSSVVLSYYEFFVEER